MSSVQPNLFEYPSSGIPYNQNISYWSQDQVISRDQGFSFQTYYSPFNNQQELYFYPEDQYLSIYPQDVDQNEYIDLLDLKEGKEQKWNQEQKTPSFKEIKQEPQATSIYDGIYYGQFTENGDDTNQKLIQPSNIIEINGYQQNVELLFFNSVEQNSAQEVKNSEIIEKPAFDCQFDQFTSIQNSIKAKQQRSLKKQTKLSLIQKQNSTIQKRMLRSDKKIQNGQENQQLFKINEKYANNIANSNNDYNTNTNTFSNLNYNENNNQENCPQAQNLQKQNQANSDFNYEERAYNSSNTYCGIPNNNKDSYTIISKNTENLESFFTSTQSHQTNSTIATNYKDKQLLLPSPLYYNSCQYEPYQDNSLNSEFFSSSDVSSQTNSKFSKKNIVKNIMSSFQRFVISSFTENSQENSEKVKSHQFQKTKFAVFFSSEVGEDQKNAQIQQIHNQILHIFNAHSQPSCSEESEEFIVKFKRYFQNRQFNNFTIQLLIKHKTFGPIFKYYLTNFFKNWLMNLNIKNGQSHIQMTDFYLQSFLDDELLNDMTNNHN